jgi:preprotein translocase subunit SecY
VRPSPFACAIIESSMKFFEAFANIFRIPDLRKRLLFTLAMLAVYRLGGHIPTPGIDANAGGVLPRIGHAVRLLRSVQRRHVPPADHLRPGHHAVHHGVDHSAVADGGGPTLEKLQKEGELGRRKITQWTRYLTVAWRHSVVRHRHALQGASGRLS